MKSTIAIFETHEKAIKALEFLDEANFPLKNVSVVGQAEIVNDHVYVKPRYNKEIGAGVGIASGSVLGVLTGVGLFAIPGFGVLFGAGAAVGAIAGIEVGAIAAGIYAVFDTIGVHKDHAVSYEEKLKEGKFLLAVQGSEEEIHKAERILEAHGQHENLLVH